MGGDDWQGDGGGVCCVVVDGLPGDGRGGAGGQIVAGAQIAAPAGMGAAGELQAQAMTSLEAVGGGPEVDSKAQRAVLLGLAKARAEAEETVADVGGAAVGGDIAETAEEVGVSQGGAHVKNQARGADDF